MSISIAGSFSPQSTVAAHSPSETATSEVVEKPVSITADTVKLSQAAQIHLMKQQGQALSQIAANLGVSVTVVDGYLGVAVPKVASASSVPAAAKAAPVPAKG